MVYSLLNWFGQRWWLYRKQLYFISVFIYTFIKVKLTEGEKKNGFAKAEPNYICRLSFFGCKRHRNPAHKTNMIRALVKPKRQPENLWIHLWFYSHNWRNNHRYALSLRTGGFGAKESHFPLFPFAWRQTKVKSVKSSIFSEKTSKFLRPLSFKT